MSETVEQVDQSDVMVTSNSGGLDTAIDGGHGDAAGVIVEVS